MGTAPSAASPTIISDSTFWLEGKEFALGKQAVSSPQPGSPGLGESRPAAARWRPSGSQTRGLKPSGNRAHPDKDKRGSTGGPSDPHRPARETPAPARLRAGSPASLRAERRAAPGNSPPGVAAGGGRAALSPPGLVLSSRRGHGRCGRRTGAPQSRSTAVQTPSGSRAAPPGPSSPPGPSPPPSATAAGRALWPALRRPESARGGGAGGGGRVWPSSYQLHGGHQLPAPGLAARCHFTPARRSRELGVGSPENPASPSRCTSSAFDRSVGEMSPHADSVELGLEPRDSGKRRLKGSLRTSLCS
ncbi:uncharacterized protein WM277_000337 [Molossus nigricans]